MHAETLERFVHDHTPRPMADNETRTRWVVVLTACMMVGELIVGWMTGSMALTADGWHMATHAGALGLSVGAYWFARTRARERAFSFGTGKIYPLAGYTSAIILALVALLMGVESVRRLMDPTTVAYTDALPVAVLGLLVNLASVWALGGDHDHPGHEAHAAHEHDHHHNDDHDDHDDHAVDAHGHQDHNLKAAYLHVLADALTSVLAIVALVAGKYLGWAALDPLMGLIGGAVILHWSYGLARGAGRQLLDMVPSAAIEQALRLRLEALDDVRVADLHLWDLGPGQRGCIVSLVTSQPRPASEYHALLTSVTPLQHVTIEVHRCPDHEEHAAA